MEVAKITSKGQMTIPKKIRETAGLAEGDVVGFIVEDGRITLRKLALDDGYLRAVQSTLSEWNSPEDEEAWRDL